MTIEIKEIARILNEMTRLFPRPDGSQPLHWEELTEAQQNRACEAVRQVILWKLSGAAGHPWQLHNIWMQGAKEDGWTYGKVYSIKDMTHPCLVPFDDLPETEKLKDNIWAGVIHLYEPYIEL